MIKICLFSEKVIKVHPYNVCPGDTCAGSEEETRTQKLSPYEQVKVKSLSRVRLFANPWTVAHQAPLSMGLSRQEYWSGLPFPPPGDLTNQRIEPRSPALQEDPSPSEPPGKLLTMRRVSIVSRAQGLPPGRCPADTRQRKSVWRIPFLI